jgi:hypothetical protein
MGGWEIWLALIGAAAVWIVGHLLRQGAQADEKGDQARQGERRPPGRPPGAGPRQPPRTELDRFLQEVNRRKQMAEERGRPPQPAARSERRPVRPQPAPAERPPARRMVEPIQEVIPVEPPRPQLDPTRRVEPAPVVALADPDPRSAGGTAAAPAPVLLAAVPTAFPPTRRQAQSPALRRLGAMFRSKENLCAAMMLREILDRPISHRRRG